MVGIWFFGFYCGDKYNQNRKERDKMKDE